MNGHRGPGADLAAGRGGDLGDGALLGVVGVDLLADLGDEGAGGQLGGIGLRRICLTRNRDGGGPEADEHRNLATLRCSLTKRGIGPHHFFRRVVVGELLVYLGDEACVLDFDDRRFSVETDDRGDLTVAARGQPPTTEADRDHQRGDDRGPQQTLDCGAVAELLRWRRWGRGAVLGCRVAGGLLRRVAGGSSGVVLGLRVARRSPILLGLAWIGPLVAGLCPLMAWLGPLVIALVSLGGGVIPVGVDQSRLRRLVSLVRSRVAGLRSVPVLVGASRGVESDRSGGHRLVVPGQAVGEARACQGVLHGGFGRDGYPESRKLELRGGLADCGEELGTVREAILRCPLTGPQHQIVDLRRHPVDDLRGGGDVLGEPAQCSFDGAATVERGLAGQQLVEQHPGGIDIGGRAQGMPLDLFGRKVGDGADDLPGGGGARRLTRTRRDRADEPEVRELDLVIGADQHVIRLDVTVDHARGVSNR